MRRHRARCARRGSARARARRRLGEFRRILDPAVPRDADTLRSPRYTEEIGKSRAVSSVSYYSMSNRRARVSARHSTATRVAALRTAHCTVLIRHHSSHTTAQRQACIRLIAWGPSGQVSGTSSPLSCRLMQPGIGHSKHSVVAPRSACCGAAARGRGDASPSSGSISCASSMRGRQRRT